MNELGIQESASLQKNSTDLPKLKTSSRKISAKNKKTKKKVVRVVIKNPTIS
jgi:hypothetical protein